LRQGIEGDSVTSALKVISSMATRHLLADMIAMYRRGSPADVILEAVGGVDAARRVQAGEAFDAVVLAANAIDQLIQAGSAVAGSRVDLVKSGVAVAVRAGAPRPDISTEACVKRAVLAAQCIGYSTGPSGVELAKLFERWGIAREIEGRIVQAPPGVAVGSLIARGEVDLGFQQLSELLNLSGVDVLGPLPPAIQIVTTFSAGIAATSAQADAARALLEFMASPRCDAVKRANGMEPA
jgi:molybdate transport system substrate-binding protein